MLSVIVLNIVMLSVVASKNVKSTDPRPSKKDLFSEMTKKDFEAKILGKNWKNRLNFFCRKTQYLFLTFDNLDLMKVIGKIVREQKN